MTAITAPPSGSGRAVTSSVRSPSASSVGSVATPFIAPRTASRTSRSCGRRSVEKGTGASSDISRRALSFSRTTWPRALTATMPSSSESITALSSASSDFERGEPRRELLGHSVQRDREVADLARRRERRPPLELAGGDRLRDVAQLDDRAARRFARTRMREPSRRGRR